MPEYRTRSPAAVRAARDGQGTQDGRTGLNGRNGRGRSGEIASWRGAARAPTGRVHAHQWPVAKADWCLPGPALPNRTQPDGLDAERPDTRRDLDPPNRPLTQRRAPERVVVEDFAGWPTRCRLANQLGSVGLFAPAQRYPLLHGNQMVRQSEPQIRTLKKGDPQVFRGARCKISGRRARPCPKSPSRRWQFRHI